MKVRVRERLSKLKDGWREGEMERKRMEGAKGREERSGKEMKRERSKGRLTGNSRTGRS